MLQSQVELLKVLRIPWLKRDFSLLQPETTLYLIAVNLIIGDFKCLIAIDYIEISFLSES